MHTGYFSKVVTVFFGFHVCNNTVCIILFCRLMVYCKAQFSNVTRFEFTQSEY